MLTLPNSTLDKLQLITSENGASVVVAFNDDDSTGAYPGGSQKTTISSATTTDICDTPGVGSPIAEVVREVHHVNICNTYAGAQPMTVQQVSSGNPYPLGTWTVPQNGVLQLTHAAGWFVSSSVISAMGVTPSGDMDGVNATFVLPDTPSGGIALYHNGQRLSNTVGYTISGATITMLTTHIPIAGDTLIADYDY